MLSLQGVSVLKLSALDLKADYFYHSPNRVTLEHFNKEATEAARMHDIVLFGSKNI